LTKKKIEVGLEKGLGGIEKGLGTVGTKIKSVRGRSRKNTPGFLTPSTISARDAPVISAPEPLGLRAALLQEYAFRIVKIMDIFTIWDNYPILMYCSSGKDESSLISALLLGILGVDERDVVDDYHNNNSRIPPGSSLETYLTSLGWTDLSFEAPKEAMVTIQQWITKNHGSISQYLDSIGFSLQKQVLIKHCLLVTDTYHKKS